MTHFFFKNIQQYTYLFILAKHSTCKNTRAVGKSEILGGASSNRRPFNGACFTSISAKILGGGGGLRRTIFPLAPPVPTPTLQYKVQWSKLPFFVCEYFKRKEFGLKGRDFSFLFFPSYCCIFFTHKTVHLKGTGCFNSNLMF